MTNKLKINGREVLKEVGFKIFIGSYKTSKVIEVKQYL